MKMFLLRCARLPSTELRITVHYTRAISEQLSKTIEEGVELPPQISLHAGRPRLSQQLEYLVDDIIMSDPAKKRYGIVVGCCGPASLRDSVRDAERGVKTDRRGLVGGVEMVEE